jgi:HMGL-like
VVGPVAEVQLVDVSLRDGNQSLWSATGLRTAHILQIAPVLNRVGFRALDFCSSTAMGVAVRTHREDPWQRIRLTRAAMPDTLLQFIGTGFRFISWERAHPDVMRLVYQRLVAAGISRFVVLDPTHDMKAVLATARMIRQAGGTEIIAALTYTISAVHDDAFYARIAGQAAASRDIDRAYIKDPAGLLTPERARTLIPAVRAQLAGKPLELHAHGTIGLSPLVYLAAPGLGVEVLQVACGALADGSSLPDAERTVANLRELGHTVTVDDRLLARAARYFDRLATAESLPSGQPRPYDAAFTRHQLADHAAAAAGRARTGGPVRGGDRGGDPGPGRARLPDHGHAVPADGHGAGVVQCAQWHPVFGRPRSGDQVRAGELRQADGRRRAVGPGLHPGPAARARAGRRAAAAVSGRAAAAAAARHHRRGTAAAVRDAGRGSGRDARRRARCAALPPGDAAHPAAAARAGLPAARAAARGG